MKRNFRGLGIYVFIFLIIVFVWRAFGSNGLNTNTCTMTEFQQELDSDQVKSIVIRQNEEVPTGNLTIVLNDGSREQMSVSDVKEIESMLKKANFEDYTLKDVPGENVWIQLLPTLLMAGVLIFFIMSMSAQSGGGSNSKMMNFGKSRAKMTMGENVNVKFSDVAGLSEEKEELEGMVDFLKDPAKYTKLGARIPKGVILVGPPGTGKTLIAKAVAGEGAYRSSLSQVLILWKCLSVSVLPVSVICSQRQKDMHRVSYLSMRSMQWDAVVEPAWAVDMTSVSRP